MKYFFLCAQSAWQAQRGQEEGEFESDVARSRLPDRGKADKKTSARTRGSEENGPFISRARQSYFRGPFLIFAVPSV